MKNIKQLLAIIFIMNFFSNVILAQEKFSLVDIKEVKVEGRFSNPKWSPDGTKLLVNKGANRGLYIIDLNNNNNISTVVDKKDGTGYGAAWSAKGDKIFYREKKGFVTTVKNYTIHTKEITSQSHLKPNAIASRSIFDENQIMVYINMKTLNIVGKNQSTGKTWDITKDGRYYNPILSPDGTKVIINRGANMFVFKSDGTGQISNLGIGIGSSWSPDSEYILTYMDEGDGHSVFNADISVVHYTGKNNVKLTNTNDKIEMSPSWSPTSDEISFSDEATGKLYTATISRK